MFAIAQAASDSDTLRIANLVVNAIQTIALAFITSKFYSTQRNGGVKINTNDLRLRTPNERSYDYSSDRHIGISQAHVIKSYVNDISPDDNKNMGS